MSIVDVGSTYGTIVNGIKLNPKVPHNVVNGVLVNLGPTSQLRIQWNPFVFCMTRLERDDKEKVKVICQFQLTHLICSSIYFTTATIEVIRSKADKSCRSCDAFGISINWVIILNDTIIVSSDCKSSCCNGQVFDSRCASKEIRIRYKRIGLLTSSINEFFSVSVNWLEFADSGKNCEIIPAEEEFSPLPCQEVNLVLPNESRESLLRGVHGVLLTAASEEQYSIILKSCGAIVTQLSGHCE